MILNEFESNKLEKIEADLTEIKDLLTNQKRNDLLNEWIPSIRIPELLNISSKTWQNYRDKRIIPFTQFGSKIYVKKSDIEAFLERHYIKKS